MVRSLTWWWMSTAVMAGPYVARVPCEDSMAASGVGIFAGVRIRGDGEYLKGRRPPPSRNAAGGSRSAWNGWRGIGQAGGDRGGDGGRARPDAELGADAADVRFDGAHAEEERPGNVAVRGSGHEETEN